MNLKHNKLSELLSHFFECLENLVSINLDRNAITKVRNNSLNKLYGIKDASSLKYNRIEIIEANAFINTTGLDNIWLSHNKLTNVSRVNWPKQKANNNNNLSLNLYISYNRLTSFKTNQLLHNLDLESNFLKSFELLSVNGITSGSTLPQVLKTFILENNNLEEILENAFLNKTRLWILNLGNNRITEINDKNLNGLDVLQSLNLSYNRIETLRKNTFMSIRKLNYLYLHNNRIQLIESNAFNNLQSLIELKLNNNKIKSITNDNYNGLNFKSSLKNLNLINNSIDYIDSNLAVNFKKFLKTIVFF